MVVENKSQSRWAVKALHYITVYWFLKRILYCDGLPCKAVIVPKEEFEVRLVLCIVVRVQVKQGRRWVLTRLLQRPGVEASCLLHRPYQPTRARPSEGTQIVLAKQPPRSVPTFQYTHIGCCPTLTTMSSKLTQAFLCRMVERVLDCKWKVMILVVHLSG